VSVKQYTAKCEKAFLEDAAALNIGQPILARARDHILEMAEFIAALHGKRVAYRTDEGSYYLRRRLCAAHGNMVITRLQKFSIIHTLELTLRT
jgi:cysteinyl-tRNA synthetase